MQIKTLAIAFQTLAVDGGKMSRFIAVALILSLFLIGCQAAPTPTPTDTPAPPPTDTTAPLPSATLAPTDTPTATLAPPTNTPVPTAAPITGTVTANANVRETPSTTAKILGQLKQGNVVNLVARSADQKWFQINFPLDSSTTAWIISSLIKTSATLTDIPSAAAPQPTTVAVSTIPGATEAGTVTPTRTATATGAITGTQTVAVTAAATPTASATPPPANAGGAPPGSVIFDSWENGQYQINRVRADGTGLTLLFGNASEPALSPSGTHLAYHKRSSGTAGRGIAIADLNGANEQVLTTVSTAGYPTWSPDGNNLAYHILPTNKISGQIWRIVIGSLETVQVGIGVRPAWEPVSGQLILFDGCKGDQCSSLLTESAFTPDIENPNLLTSGTNPAWSPSGSQIAFQESDANGHVNIFIANRDGTNKRQVTKNAGNNGNPIWSRDGQWIFYRSDSDPSGWAIFAVRTDGSSNHKIVNAPVNADEWVYEKLAIAP
jgi:hypothetical protein